MKILPTGIAVIEGDTHASKWIEEQGRLDYDGEVAKTIEPLLKPGDTALDVGAMLGAYSMGMKRAVGPTGKVYAFEPNIDAYECLTHNCPDVLCLGIALGDRAGYGSIKRSEKYPDNAGASYVDNDGEDSIPISALDSIWQGGPIAFMKIDAEGMEPEVIRGARKTLQAFRPILFIEINHDVLRNKGYEWHHVIDPLTDMGYKPRFLDPRHNFREKDWPQLDLLMMP